MHVVRRGTLSNLKDLPEGVRPALDALPRVTIRQPRPAGFPLLFTSDWNLVEPAVEYLHEHAVQRARTPETVRTYSEILFDWFETLEQNAICWRGADAIDLVAYRNRMLSEPSPRTGRPYKTTTINLRVRGVLRFYRWAVRTRWLSASPLAEPSAEMFASAKRSQEARATESSIFALRQFETLPRPLSRGQLDRLVGRLPMPYDLMVKWQAATGLRVSELLRLKTTDVVSSATDAEGRLINVLRKGRKPGFVIAPAELLEESRAYVRLHRDLWIRRRQRKGRAGAGTELFVGPRGSPVLKNTYQRAVRVAGSSCDFAVVSHALRATFACTLLAQLEKAVRDGADLNPLFIVKVLLGHERIETTDRYLRSIVVDDCALMEAIESLIPTSDLA
ncbi:tyrosine-type recombinase/integrase [Roseateles sp. P5_D6]